MSLPLATRTLPLTELPAWKALLTHFQEVRVLHLRQLFEEDPRRGTQFEPAHVVAAAKAQILGRRSIKQVGIARTE